MKEKVIKTNKIKGDLKFDGKIIFKAGLGRVEIEGVIEASLGIEIKDRTNIYSGGNISSGGDIYSSGYISSGGNISSGGYISSGGNIFFSFHIRFKTKISCTLLRILRDDEFERSFWAEKLSLFGFKKVAEIIGDTNNCVNSIRGKIIRINGIQKKLLACKYWTKTERMVIISWLDGKLKDYKLE